MVLLSGSREVEALPWGTSLASRESVMTSRRVARAEWLKDEGTLAASRAASEVMVVTAEAAMLEDSDVALVNGLGAAHFVETFW